MPLESPTTSVPSCFLGEAVGLAQVRQPPGQRRYRIEEPQRPFMLEQALPILPEVPAFSGWTSASRSRKHRNRDAVQVPRNRAGPTAPSTRRSAADS